MRPDQPSITEQKYVHCEHQPMQQCETPSSEVGKQGAAKTTPTVPLKFRLPALHLPHNLLLQLSDAPPQPWFGVLPRRR